MTYRAVSQFPAPFMARFYEELPSTSDEAKALAAEGAPHGTVVIAKSQTAGRGRQDRNWVSPPGNLYLSAILRPDLPPARAAQAGFVAAVAVGETVRRLLPDSRSLPDAGRVTLKWPNDVLIAGAKVAGILPESAIAGGSLAWIVLGIGLNLAHAPAETTRPATALRNHVPDVPAPGAAAALLLRDLASWYERWLTEGFQPVLSEWLRHATAIGGTIEVRLGGVVRTGRFAGLDEDAALLLETPNGRERITAGEVGFA